MKLRKTVSLILALVLALSLAVPTFAANSYTANASAGEVEGDTVLTGNSASFDVNVSTTFPNIRVIITDVANTGAIILNPYGMEADASSIGLGNTKDQIISRVQYIKNLSDANVQVDIQSVVKTSSSTNTNGIVLKTSSVKQDTASKDKGVFLFLETTFPTLTAVDTYAGKVANGDDTAKADDLGLKGTYDKKSKQQVVISSTSTKGVTLTPGILAAGVPQGGGSATPGDISNLEPAATNGVLAFKVGGDCANVLADGNWAATDTVSFTLTFTFTATGVTAGPAA